MAKLPRISDDTGISFDAQGEPYIHWLYGDIGAIVRRDQSLYNVAFPATPLVGVVVDTTHVYSSGRWSPSASVMGGSAIC